MLSKDSPDNCRSFYTEDHMEGQEQLACLLLRLSLCRRSSYPHPFMPVRAGAWQQNSRDSQVQALAMRCYRRLLNIFYKDHVTNEEVRNRIQTAIGEHDVLLTMEKKRKLRWHGQISRASAIAKTMLYGTVKEARRRGRHGKTCENNIKEWTDKEFGDSLRAAKDREG